MAGGRKSKISVTSKAKPDISVSSASTRSKAITLNRDTTRGSQSSRSIVETPPPLSRSKAIAKLDAPSSRTRSKAKEVSSPQTHSRFFSKRNLVGPSTQQRVSVPSTNGAGGSQPKSTNRDIKSSQVRGAVGELKNFPPRRPLTFSEL